MGESHNPDIDILPIVLEGWSKEEFGSVIPQSFNSIVANKINQWKKTNSQNLGDYCQHQYNSIGWDIIYHFKN